ncbi:hypothetical protein FIBSPDRAFT_958988 [Athelia psychrophila]|uniref:Uncharacterized protein n=1 Tax=Athelia psychrophila TaxID=1759441 RepID=A0A166E2V4_9AGAM|nr:hypothetical protein FIBSPDRAFT_958988 [Fibularhizoctonia sp. CBS 109695]
MRFSHPHGEVVGITFLPIDLAATVIILGLTASYVLYIIIAAVMDKVHGNPFLPGYSDDPPPSFGTPQTVFCIGRRRTPTERTTVADHCASYIFQRSVFRKHAFEPTGWAIFRGIIAVYCFVGLLVFAAYTGYSAEETHASGGITIQETVVANATVASKFDRHSEGVNFFYLSVAALTPVWQSIPPDFTVSRNWPKVPPGYLEFQNMTALATPSDAPNSQLWIDDSVPDYPWIEDYSFNVSWSGDVTLDTWVTVAAADGHTNSTQAIYSPGSPLFPFKDYVITQTIISYEMNGFPWLFLEPKILSAVDSGSNKTTASFSCRWQTQRQLTHRELISSSSGPALFAQALSAFGGLYTSIDVVFALIFGRTVLAILFSTRAISPFGLLGLITRHRFRRLINEQYPRLQEDIEHDGMTTYISEVAIDPGLVPNSTSAKLRARAATSSQAQASYARDDAEEAGLISLRSMEPSNTSGKSSHSQLQLPYAIEAYEPARKHDYE